MLAAALGIAVRRLIPLVQAEVRCSRAALPDLVEQLLGPRRAVAGASTSASTLALDLSTLKQVVAENLESARDLSLRLLAGRAKRRR